MKTLFRSVILALGVAGSGAVLAQASSIEAVIQEARSASAAAQQLFNQRAAQFQAADEATRTTMMNEARAQRDALAAEVAQKSATFSENDLDITAANTELRGAANAVGLGELFGLARQVASDTVTQFQQSLTGAQYPDDDRIAFLQALGAETRMLTTPQLERLWLELSQEMVSQGEVVKYNGTVVLPGGATESAQIVRVGRFTATAGDRYLAYMPELNRLTVLPRQLGEPFSGDAARLSSATSGYVQATVDGSLSTGQLLSMYVERPTLEERIELGEEVGYVIIVVGLLGAVIFVLQLLYLIFARLKVSSQVRNPGAPRANNALGRVL
ncbi:MAG: hypothetical protein LBE21_08535, partial [Pseudomonadales bacterium]|nr:hypothetical protein [Pseudomonadales bacterium]